MASLVGRQVFVPRSANNCIIKRASVRPRKYVVQVCSKNSSSCLVLASFTECVQVEYRALATKVSCDTGCAIAVRMAARGYWPSGAGGRRSKV